LGTATGTSALTIAKIDPPKDGNIRARQAQRGETGTRGISGDILSGGYFTLRFSKTSNHHRWDRLYREWSE
jgi:hypothetical protein